MKYFTSDWHLGHEGTMKFMGRPFENLEEMHEKLEETMFGLPRGSELYHLGDGAWNTNVLSDFLRRKPNYIQLHWIYGNHDNRINFKSLSKYIVSVDYIKDIRIGKQKITLSHCPFAIWNNSCYNGWNLHGHIHQVSPKYTPIGKQLNVNVEFHDYKPWSFTEVVREMGNREAHPEFLEIVRRKEC